MTMTYQGVIGVWELLHFYLLASKIFREAFRNIHSYLSIPVRRMAFWANSGYNRLSREPFMAAFKALVGFKNDFFHALSMNIIILQST